MATVTQGGINLIIWTIVFTILDLIFVFLRFWSARLIGRRIQLDDYFILVSLASALALDGVVVWAVFVGHIGHYQTELSTSEIAVSLKTIPAAYVTWTTGTAAFKLSVLFLYQRIFTTKAIKIWSYTLIALTVGYWISFLVVFLTTCTPDISQLWNPRPGGFCRDLNIGQLGSVSTNLAIDVFVIILPMPFLWNLQMRMRNKVAVTMIFSLGLITIAIMIWRIVDLVSNKDVDFIYNEPTLALTTTLEMWLCIIIACFPTLGPIGKVYIAPAVSKMTSRFSGGSTPKTKTKGRSIITFGRLGGRTRKNYTTMTYGSQEHLEEQIGTSQRDNWDSSKFRDDAFTATNITSDMDREGLQMDTLAAPSAIHVQQEVQTHQEPRV
ncbi:putative integral membrane protein [Rosellinia necatrix]|uniref:Putative integral membrane protein n=1 Tax=Rosellinia necatrix TaxID=77044 RepID=A0A1W2TCB9_ROSNE|nr:putative integral membrane protein [Rosellinia necatrix]